MLRLGKKIAIILCILSIYILTSVHSAQASTTSTRLYGNDRYLTAIEVSKNGWPNGADTVILTTGENFPDALSAAPLASKYKAPILLVNSSGLSQETATELKRLSVKKAYIVGGKGVISSSLEKQLSLMGISSVRLGGQDRYDTALEVAKLVGTSQGLFVTSGLNFADALSIAPIAAAKGMPLLLVPDGDLTQNEKTFISKLKLTKTYIVGGENQIPDIIRNQFRGAENITGADAYERNIALLQYFGDSLNQDTTYVATGEDFPDALTAAALAQKDKNPLVLVKGNQLPSAAQTYLSSKVISEVKVFGGYGIISQGFETSLKTLPAQISTVKDITARILEKQKYDLPKTVSIKTSQGNWEEMPVTWDLTTVSTLKAGKYYFNGKVKGYNGSVVLTLIVDPQPSKVDKLTAEIVLGDSYTLPDMVNVTMSDNSIQQFPVTWSTSMGLLNKVGTYTFQGTLEGTSVKASLTLKVSEDQAVAFNDDELERVIREEIGKEDNTQTIYKSDVLKVNSLDAQDCGISDLTGIEVLTNLNTLNLEDNNLTGESLSPLQKLTNLHRIELQHNDIDQLSALKSLTSLTYLNVKYNDINDFSALRSLVQLKKLYLYGNESTDYSSIRVFYDQLTSKDFEL